MNRKPVTSSNIRSVGYDENSQTLEVEFNSNDVYQYLNVPARIHVELMSAGSKGQYFIKNIKEVFEYRKV